MWAIPGAASSEVIERMESLVVVGGPRRRVRLYLSDFVFHRTVVPFVRRNHARSN